MTPRMIEIICEFGIMTYSGDKGTFKMRSIMSLWSWKAGLAGVAIVAATAYAVAQMPDHARMHEQMNSGGSGQQQMMPQDGMRGQMMHGQRGMMMGSGTNGLPVMSGQDAFGTI